MSSDSEIVPSSAAELAAWQEPSARREQAMIQAALVMARANPRDVDGAFERVRKSCMRPGFAKLAFFAYKRGDGEVSGLTIRVAELLAQNWGNIRWGHRVVARTGQFSKVEVFAWDTETNAYVTREIMVKHWRDTTGGGHELKSERDIKELIDNQAQRTVRSLIFNVMPADYMALAGRTCEETLEKEDGEVPLIDRARASVAYMADNYGLTKDRLLAYWKVEKLEEVSPRHLLSLKKIISGLQQGETQIDDIFPPASKAADAKKPDLASVAKDLGTKNAAKKSSDFDKAESLREDAAQAEGK